MEPFPLNWPLAYPRTKKPHYARFKTTQDVAQKELMKELKALGATEITITTNIPIRQDGLPYANWQKREITDYGVAVYFTYKKQQTVLCCDAWNTFAGNMQAIRLTVEAMRGLERWGVSEMLNRMFQGFSALPAASTPDWYIVFELEETATPEEVKSRWKELCLRFHPDRETGNEEKYVQICQAYQKYQTLNP